MTSVTGYWIVGAPCCGARYKRPRYGSINLMSAAFWTDGYREQSLMPNDHGLRRCQCGRFMLQRDLVDMAEEIQSDLPLAPRVAPQELPLAIAQAIAQADRPDAYRALYRAHRDAEDAATRAAWERDHKAAASHERRLWQRLLKKPYQPSYHPAPDRPITFPAFEATAVQRENMQALLGLLADGPQQAYTRVELHRELGQFDAAAQALHSCKQADSPWLYALSAKLIGERQSAPVRYSP